jgi:hypothetical protein
LKNNQTNKMSFLARRAATLSIPRTALATVPRASFTTTVLLRKTATETVKDGVKAVDRAVSDKLVDGINIGGKWYNIATESPALLRGQPPCVKMHH